jgi:2-keto-3-deoxy-L-rhamnonate aldolase RhmA
MSLDTASQISVAALDTGISPIVRVPAMQMAMATRALDGGALGIIMPHVDTAAEARAIVDHLKYPPVGHRSVSGAQPQFDYRAMQTGELTAALNAATLTIVMVETPKAIANVDAIAAVPGVDVVLVGTNDLAAEMRIPGDFANPKIAAAYKKIIAACKKHKKWPGMGGVYSDELMKKYVGLGMRMILGGGDVGMLMQAATQRSSYLRGCT